MENLEGCNSAPQTLTLAMSRPCYPLEGSSLDLIPSPFSLPSLPPTNSCSRSCVCQALSQVPGVWRQIGHSLPGKTDAEANGCRTRWHESEQKWIQDDSDDRRAGDGRGHGKDTKVQAGSRGCQKPEGPCRSLWPDLCSSRFVETHNLMTPRALHLFMRSLESELTIYLFNFQQEGEDLSGSGIRLA